MKSIIVIVSCNSRMRVFFFFIEIRSIKSYNIVTYNVHFFIFLRYYWPFCVLNSVITVLI